MILLLLSFELINVKSTRHHAVRYGSDSDRFQGYKHPSISLGLGANDL